ncbi:MAG: hypothetical protein A3H35_11080 [Betaproteobacteria bacterium RIFCSPLOWO2_02_FULL_62_17]|nr:MAG: hypothetical protein A3H35_11080 [Betaproteobacteria bacterium RIFCSPLOWO2_02_FULL_62_17]
MALDIFTLLLVLLLCNLVMAGALWIAFSGSFHNGLEKWGISLLLQADAWAMFMANAFWPGYFVVVAGQVLLCTSFTLQAGALIEFRQHRAAPACIFGPPIGLVLLSLALAGSPAAAGVVINLIQAVCCAAIIGQLTRQDLHHRRGTRWLVIAAYLLMLVIFLAHASFSLAGLQHTAMLIDPGQWPSVCVLGAIVYVVIASFGFLLLQKERAEDEMRELATMDPLTGVFNRRTFIQLAERELARCRRSGQPLRLLMLDLDHFKNINDTRGHLVGDDVILEFSRSVADCLRREDLLVRYGGEEFCVLLPDADTGTALTLAERIRAMVDNSLMQTRAGPVHITTSVGVCGDDANAIDSLDSLLSCADNALYLAKAAGRNQVVSSPYKGEKSLIPQAASRK